MAEQRLCVLVEHNLAEYKEERVDYSEPQIHHVCICGSTLGGCFALSTPLSDSEG